MGFHKTARHSQRAGVNISLGFFLAFLNNIHVKRGSLVQKSFDAGVRGSHELVTAAAFVVEYIDTEGSMDVTIAHIHHGNPRHGPHGVQVIVDSLVLPNLGPSAVFIQATQHIEIKVWLRIHMIMINYAASDHSYSKEFKSSAGMEMEGW